MDRHDKIMATIMIPLITISWTAFLINLSPGYNMGIGTGNSMQPNMSNPSIYVAKLDPDTIKEGEVVSDGGIIHRVVEKNETHLIRKGDNNDYRDEPIKYSEVSHKRILNIPTPWKDNKILETAVDEVL